MGAGKLSSDDKIVGVHVEILLEANTIINIVTDMTSLARKYSKRAF